MSIDTEALKERIYALEADLDTAQHADHEETIRALVVAADRLAALKAENERLREALEDADNELDWLDEDIGIGCDHSAGVCTCDYWNMRRKMKAALSKETNHD